MRDQIHSIAAAAALNPSKENSFLSPDVDQRLALPGQLGLT